MTGRAPIELAADVEAALRRLRLSAIRREAPEVLATAKAQRWPPEELLRVLVQAEIASRDASNTRNRMAGSPTPPITRRTRSRSFNAPRCGVAARPTCSPPTPPKSLASSSRSTCCTVCAQPKASSASPIVTTPADLTPHVGERSRSAIRPIARSKESWPRAPNTTANHNPTSPPPRRLTSTAPTGGLLDDQPSGPARAWSPTATR